MSFTVPTGLANSDTPVSLTVSDKDRATIDFLLCAADSFLNIVITNDATLEEALAWMKRTKSVLKSVETARKAVTSQLDSAKKAIMAKEKELTGDLNTALSKVKSLTDIYLEERARQALEAKKKALAAAEAARHAFEVAQIAAANGKEVDEAELAATLANAEAPLTATELSALTPLGTATARTTWDYTIIDLAQVPRRFLVPDPTAIRAELQHLKKQGIDITAVNIPGINVYAKTTTVLK